MGGVWVWVSETGWMEGFVKIFFFLFFFLLLLSAMPSPSNGEGEDERSAV